MPKYAMRGLVILVVLVMASMAAAGLPGKSVKEPGTAANRGATLRRTALSDNTSPFHSQRVKNAPADRGANASQAASQPRLMQWAESDRPLQVVRREDASVYIDSRVGVIAIHPPLGQTHLSKGQAGEAPSETTLRFLESRSNLLGLTQPRRQLSLENTRSDASGMTHLRLRQRIGGTPVWGRELTVHLDSSGNLVSINGLVEPAAPETAESPAIEPDKAIAVAEKWLADQALTPEWTPNEAAAFGLEYATATSWYWQSAPRQPLSLIWIVEIRPNFRDWWRLFIDASDGRILDRYNATNFDGPATASALNLAGETVTLNTYQTGGQYYLIDASRAMFEAGQTAQELTSDPKGVVWTLDLRDQDANNESTIYHFTSTDNTWSDPVAVSAHDYTGRVYQFYRGLGDNARDSYDDQGASMLTLVHVAQNGQPMDNAFWNGSVVALGDGQSAFSPLAGSLDVIAHEYTHAVVQHTANLEYKFQSGALNETFADIGGVCVDDDDFLLGEDIVSLQYFPTGSMRNMGDPHNGATGPQDFTWQPAHMSEYQNLTMEEDNGGVHVNNGITNFAACKILSRLGRQEGQRILFRALENYLTQQSNFSDFRIAAVRAAGDLFGEDSMQQQTVMTAFDEVGIVQGSGTTPPPDSPPVSGSQYILAVNDEVDLFDIEDHSLVISDGFDDLSEDPAFYYLTNTQALTPSGRPIAVDAYGQDIYFVDADYNLRAIRPDGSGEEIVSDTGDWWSIALSPSGRYLAMTRDISENIIVVYDLRDDTVTELPLFHPTTDHNNNYADVVDYADSLAFLDDHLLAYDCSNSIQSPDGGTLDFWDVNVIDVTDGRIFPVLPPQRAGVHVGNPIFASTNASILCVEVFEDGVGNSVTGINLVSGDASVILDNGLDLAYPDYSVDDQDLLITHTNMAGRRDLYRLPLNADKISPAGTPVFLLPEVKLPVWFAQGTPPTAVVAFSSASSQAQECDSVVQIPVSLSETPTGTVTVDYAVTGGNAIGSGVDYTLESGILTFEGSAIAAIPLSLNNDDLHEQNESLTITLSRPVNAWLGDADRHTFTIRDDDSTTGVARNVWMLYE